MRVTSLLSMSAVICTTAERHCHSRRYTLTCDGNDGLWDGNRHAV